MSFQLRPTQTIKPRVTEPEGMRGEWHTHAEPILRLSNRPMHVEDELAPLCYESAGWRPQSKRSASTTAMHIQELANEMPDIYRYIPSPHRLMYLVSSVNVKQLRHLHDESEWWEVPVGVTVARHALRDTAPRFEHYEKYGRTFRQRVHDAELGGLGEAAVVVMFRDRYGKMYRAKNGDHTEHDSKDFTLVLPGGRPLTFDVKTKDKLERYGPVKYAKIVLVVYVKEGVDDKVFLCGWQFGSVVRREGADISMVHPMRQLDFMLSAASSAYLWRQYALVCDHFGEGLLDDQLVRL